MSKASSWWLCRGGTEPAINLVGLSPEGRHAFATEFGLLFKRTEAYPFNALAAFESSPAFRSLCDWCAEHPRKFSEMRNHDGDSELGNWPERVASALASSNNAVTTKPTSPRP